MTFAILMVAIASTLYILSEIQDIKYGFSTVGALFALIPVFCWSYFIYQMAGWSF